MKTPKTVTIEVMPALGYVLQQIQFNNLPLNGLTDDLSEILSEDELREANQEIDIMNAVQKDKNCRVTMSAYLNNLFGADYSEQDEPNFKFTVVESYSKPVTQQYNAFTS